MASGGPLPRDRRSAWRLRNVSGGSRTNRTNYRKPRTPVRSAGARQELRRPPLVLRIGRERPARDLLGESRRALKQERQERGTRDRPIEPPLRPRQSVPVCRLARSQHGARRATVHGPRRRLLGQCPRRIVLRDLQNRDDRSRLASEVMNASTVQSRPFFWCQTAPRY